MEDYTTNRQASPAAEETRANHLLNIVRAIAKKGTLSRNNKYGGLTLRKKPLISKDHKRAFFDSADWALYKHGGGGTNQTLTVAMETLQPKLKKTPHQQLPPRRPTCTSG